MLENPIYIIDFSTEVISQTKMFKETNKRGDFFQIFSNLAGKRLGIPNKSEQLKFVKLMVLQVLQ